jgi:hypothetical protein
MTGSKKELSCKKNRPWCAGAGGGGAVSLFCCKVDVAAKVLYIVKGLIFPEEKKNELDQL